MGIVRRAMPTRTRSLFYAFALAAASLLIANTLYLITVFLGHPTTLTDYLTAVVSSACFLLFCSVTTTMPGERMPSDKAFFFLWAGTSGVLLITFSRMLWWGLAISLIGVCGYALYARACTRLG